jgi:hypothetical protein
VAAIRPDVVGERVMPSRVGEVCTGVAENAANPITVNNKMTRTPAKADGEREPTWASTPLSLVFDRIPTVWQPQRAAVPGRG